MDNLKTHFKTQLIDDKTYLSFDDESDFIKFINGTNYFKKIEVLKDSYGRYRNLQTNTKIT